MDFRVLIPLFPLTLKLGNVSQMKDVLKASNLSQNDNLTFLRECVYR